MTSLESFAPLVEHLKSLGLLGYPANLKHYAEFIPSSPFSHNLGFVVISSGDFFRKCVVPEFVNSDFDDVHVVDRALKKSLASAIDRFTPSHVKAKLHIVDRPNSPAEFVHAQTLLGGNFPARPE